MYSNGLMQLTYISRISWAGKLNPRTLADIQQLATANNYQHGITGILCYGNGCFFQCIEGNKSELSVLKDNICIRDRRHKDVRIHHFTAIEQRHYQGWTMQSLFLEHWLMSKADQKRLTPLARFIPFKPFSWSTEDWNEFMSIIETFDQEPQQSLAAIRFNAIGRWLSAIAAPHQAFLLVQSVLLIAIIVSLLLLLQT